MRATSLLHPTAHNTTQDTKRVTGGCEDGQLD